MENNKIVLKLDNVSKSYDDKTVLKNIDLSIKKGTIMGLVGKNGSGKTTMIKGLLGLLKLDTGKASLFDADSWDLPAEIKQKIGYVPQTINMFDGWMTAAAIIEYVSVFYDKWNNEKVSKLLKDWHIDPNAKFKNLSEGEKQKVAIILAMGHEPELYIFDEPVASLDPVARRSFIKELIDINLDSGSTMLFSTHITSDLERIAADVALLKDNEIKYMGDLSTLKETVVKLHVQSDIELKKDQISCDNIISKNISGKVGIITVNGISEEEIKRLEYQLPAKITVEQMNLEDIFLELNK
ncbi:MAG: ABC transporter ATP-binding protein [Candidatus Delongbacteria bacterium]|jgi:ABC-2 type transport system ATP-binding protein|nr:ABC transporter ATP-binding protein [Candidatus Delongbacteria bacterium]